MYDKEIETLRGKIAAESRKMALDEAILTVCGEDVEFFPITVCNFVHGRPRGLRISVQVRVHPGDLNQKAFIVTVGRIDGWVYVVGSPLIYRKRLLAGGFETLTDETKIAIKCQLSPYDIRDQEKRNSLPRR